MNKYVHLIYPIRKYNKDQMKLEGDNSHYLLKKDSTKGYYFAPYSSGLFDSEEYKDRVMVVLEITKLSKEEDATYNYRFSDKFPLIKLKVMVQGLMTFKYIFVIPLQDDLELMEFIGEVGL